MNLRLQRSVARMQPICDSLLVNPSPEVINVVKCTIAEMKNELLQEMHLFVLFPVATHLKSAKMRNRHEILRQLVEVVTVVLNKISIPLPDMFVKYHTCLLNLVFDKSNPGMVATVSEELMLGVMECMTTLILKTIPKTRLILFQTHVPLLAQTIYIAAHISKQEKLRALRLASIVCLTAYIGIHPDYLNPQYKVTYKKLEASASEMGTSILPGVVCALQHVACSVDNPGQFLIVAALNAIHKCICLVISDKSMSQKENVTIEDFNTMLKEKAKIKHTKEVDKNSKLIPKRTPEWYAMVGEKLKPISRSILYLFTHENFNVRMEIAVFCVRMLFECAGTMQPSMTFILDILIALTKDSNDELAKYAAHHLNLYFSSVSTAAKINALDIVSENFLTTLHTLPLVLNNIDSAKKLASLNLLYGYARILAVDTNPPRLNTVLSFNKIMPNLCGVLIEASQMTTAVSMLMQHCVARDVTAPVSNSTPWCKLKHIDDKTCENCLIELCQMLGDTDCADLIVDQFMDLLDNSVEERKECVYVCNWIGSAPKSSPTLIHRILDKYTEAELWYLPLEIRTESSLTEADTYDVNVYNPRAWDKDRVPGLYEGTIETRYTDISLSKPRLPPQREPNSCATLGEAQDNMVLSCLLTEGVGILAKRLMGDFQPYLLKTLSLILERVGSKYEMLHLAGLKAINDISIACGHRNVAELIRENADYFTFQVTMRLKKAWNSQSALQILSVVMEFSDSSIISCLYGIVSDVLVQSCDKYHEIDLNAYLQVFLTFVTCIQRWFPKKKPPTTKVKEARNVMHETIEYFKNQAEAEELLKNTKTKSATGKTAEEMYHEDEAEKQNGILDYDDRVTDEKKPLPQHISLTVTILKRCLNFISSKKRDEKILSLQVIDCGLTILSEYEDELLPLVHLIWSPLIARLDDNEAVVTRQCCKVVVKMTIVSKDFIKARIEKQVLPTILKFLVKARKNSYLKDKGSAFRSSQEFKLQIAFIQALIHFVPHLKLQGSCLEEAMVVVYPYLSNRQPKPLQELAVKFFKMILEYDLGACWYHLRAVCSNEHILEPPDNVRAMTLTSVSGIPFDPLDKCFTRNVSLIFKQINYTDVNLKK